MIDILYHNLTILWDSLGIDKIFKPLSFHVDKNESGFFGGSFCFLVFIFVSFKGPFTNTCWGAWCQKGGLKHLDPCKGGTLKKIATHFPMKKCLHTFVWGSPTIFVSKRGPWNFLRSEGGGGAKTNFTIRFFFCIRPPLQVFVNGP